MRSDVSAQGNGGNALSLPSNVRARTRARARITYFERALQTVASVANAGDCWANRQSETVAQTVATRQTVASSPESSGLAGTFPSTIAGLIADAIRLQRRLGAGRPAQLRLQILQEEIGKLRKLLIEIFAEQSGWRHSEAWFTPSMLARRGTRYNPWRDGPDWSGRFIDHSYCFRAQKGQAAAFATNPYGLHWMANNPDISAFCEHFRLQAAIPDFPSWWFPSRTTLIVFTPLAEHSSPTDLQNKAARAPP